MGKKRVGMMGITVMNCFCVSGKDEAKFFFLLKCKFNQNLLDRVRKA